MTEANCVTTAMCSVNLGTIFPEFIGMMLLRVQDTKDDDPVTVDPVKNLVRKTRSEQPMKSPVIIGRTLGIFVKALN